MVKQLEFVLAEANDKLFVALEEFPGTPSLLRSRLRITGTWPWTESGRERGRAGEGRGEGGRRLGMQFLFGVCVLPEVYRLFASLVSVVCTPLSASSGSRHST